MKIVVGTALFQKVPILGPGLVCAVSDGILDLLVLLLDPLSILSITCVRSGLVKELTEEFPRNFGPINYRILIIRY